jgi:hypothetical protein
MSETDLSRGSRRSTRVPLKVLLIAQSLTEPLTCDGETIIVNRHGALVFTTVPLSVGIQVLVHVIITDKRAAAEVVFIHPERTNVCGIALKKPENIWGLSLPPDDWHEDSDES